MRLVSPLLKRAVYPALHRSGWLDRIGPPGGYAVVNYHGVIPAGYADGEKFLDGNLVLPEALRQELQFLKSHYHVLDPEEFRAWIEQGKPAAKRLAPRSVLITCDDGLLNTFTDMLPVLQEENVRCLFFVTSASSGRDPGMLWYEELYHIMRLKPLNQTLPHLPLGEGARTLPMQSAENFQAQWWSAVRRASQLNAEQRADWLARVRAQCGGQPGSPEKRWRLLNSGELRKLAEAGMTIGAHTRTHPVLSLSSEEEARREIQECKTEIECALGRAVWAFAYPFGNPATMGDREFHLAQQAGYSCAFLNVERWAGQEANPFALTRTHVTADMALPELAAHLSGVHLRLQRAVGG